MSAKPGAPRVLHLHESFGADRPSVQRSVRLMDAFGARLAHAVVSSTGEWSAADLLPRGIRISRVRDFPALGGYALPGRLQRIARAMEDYDLVLTYGRGAVQAALAHTMFSKVYALPALIHHEDGSDETPRQRRGLRSKWYRRVGLGKAAGLVVPTETMEHAALIDWQQPLGRVKLIRDGVDLKRFARAAKPDVIPRLLKRPGELWLGCFGPPGSEADIIALVQEVEKLAPEWHLVIAGPAPEGGQLAAAIARHGLDHRVHGAPGSTERAAAFALFDVVAAVRGPEPLPAAVIQAMAAGKPVVAFDTGEAAQSLARDNTDLLAGRSMAEALQQLAGDKALRQRIGAANYQEATAERDEVAMIAAYRRLYSSAIGRDSL